MTNNSKFGINENYLDGSFSKEFEETMQGNNPATPFPCFELKNFIANRDILAELRSELERAKWTRKENDLYSLEQTKDLANISAVKFPLLSRFLDFMCNEVRNWLSSMSGIELDEKVAITGSRYSDGDNLLPHDDRLEKRAFAFALYLTPDWEEERLGGRLSLFSTDPSTSHAHKVVRRIIPRENTLSLFPVRFDSWHSVEEVTTTLKSRLSLNGWFFSNSIPKYPDPAEEEMLHRKRLPLSHEIEANPATEKWLHPSWLSSRSEDKNAIRKHFERGSEASLENFFSPPIIDALYSELEQLEFEAVGPPNKRNFSRLSLDSIQLPNNLKAILELFRSIQFTQLLSELTGLDFHPPNSKNGCTSPSSTQPPTKMPRIEEQNRLPKSPVEMGVSIERWSHGCYSTMDDQMAKNLAIGGHTLDLFMFVGHPVPWEWAEEWGGFTVFFEPNEKEELTRIVPKQNTLFLVFREPDVLMFTKYVNNRVKQEERRFYTIHCSYQGFTFDEEEGKAEDESGEDEAEDSCSYTLDGSDESVGNEEEGDEMDNNFAAETKEEDENDLAS